MATKPRARKTAEEKAKPASNLLEALKFISVAQHSDGTPMQTHCRISNQTVVGFDGGLTVGHFIEEDLNVCPHTQTLIAALGKCKESITITEQDSGKLRIKSGKFSALVPCIPFGDVPAVFPDDPCANITDTVKSALAACVPLASDKAPEPFMCGVLLQGQTAVSTNRHVIIEAWHGIDLPPDILLPRASVMAICKTDKQLKSFGFSQNSATFFFEDNSFIKTQLYAADTFPRYGKVLDVESNPMPLPAGFYEALENILPFTEKEAVYFIDGKMSTTVKAEEGTTYDVPGLPERLGFNGGYLKLIRPHAHRMAFAVTEKGLSVFFGDNVRGGVMGLSVYGD